MESFLESKMRCARAHMRLPLGSWEGLYYTHFSLGKSVQVGKGAMRSTLCEAPTRETRPDHYTGNSVPCTLFDKCMGSLTSPADYITLKMQEMGPTIYHPYPRRLETSYHLQMSLQRKHVLLSYFKTLSVGPVWGSNPRPPAQQSGALPTELTG